MVRVISTARTRSRWRVLAGVAGIALAVLASGNLAVARPQLALLGQSSSGLPDEKQVEAVLRSYKDAIERLDATGTEPLFAPDVQIFESGGGEGTYQQYLTHHLGPELVEFASFKFNNYTLAIRFEGGLALATESYTYRIVLKSGGEPIERIGVATSVLRKEGGSWRIIQLHSSSRKPKAAATPASK